MRPLLTVNQLTRYLRLFAFFTLIISVIFSTTLNASTQKSILKSSVKSSRLHVNSIKNMRANGVIDISVLEENKWRNVGQLGFDQFFRSRELNITRLSSPRDKIRIRLKKVGGGAGHIDCVTLNQQSPSSLNQEGPNKIAIKDFDVAQVDETGIEIVFNAEAGVNNVADLKLTARVEAKEISDVPFLFPSENMFSEINEQSVFYKYFPGSQKGKLTIDGQLSSEDLKKPLFVEKFPVMSGHPQGTNYGWVKNDENNLYVALDFTPDNTLDGEKDYGKVFVKTKTGIRTFKVNTREKKWGVPGYVYTERVGYQHKVYEFAIPFSEIGYHPNQDHEPIELAFALYGTASTGYYYPALAFDSINDQYLLVYFSSSASSVVSAQLLDDTGSPVGSAIQISETTGQDSFYAVPSVAFSPTSNRYLVVWVDFPASNKVMGQFVSGDGTLVGSNFYIASSSGDKYTPAVAFDSANDRFIVVWKDYTAGNNDIYGQIVSANGTLFDHNDDGTSDALTDNFKISTNSASQSNPSVVFDSSLNRYLVVWEDTRNSSSNTMVFGQFVNPDGTLVDQDGDGYLEPDNSIDATDDSIQITSLTGKSGTMAPVLAIDSINHRCLTIWQDFERKILTLDTTTGAATVMFGARRENIKGLAFDEENNVLYGSDYDNGNLLTIDQNTGELSVVGAFSGGGSVYITGLAFDINSNTLYGADADNGNLYTINPSTGAATLVGTLNTYNIYGLAYDPSSDILYGYDTGAYEVAIINKSTAAIEATTDTGYIGWIEGISFNENNGLIYAADYSGGSYPYALYTIDPSDGSFTSLGSIYGFEDVVGLAYDPNVDTLWGVDTNKNNDIFGQQTNADGTSYNTDNDTNFAVENSGVLDKAPALAFNSANGQFLAAWAIDDYWEDGTKQANNDSYFGRLIFADGSLGSKITIHEYSQTTMGDIAIAANSNNGTFLTAYFDDVSDDSIWDISTTLIQADYLAFPSGTANGVLSGTNAGDSFIFQIEYFGTSAPTQTELWIDLDGDGQYVAAGNNLFVYPNSGGNNTWTYGLLTISGIFLFIGLGARAQKKWIPAASTAFATLLIMTTLGLSGCQPVADDENGDNGTTLNEKYTMIEVDSSDSTYSDGKTYSVSITIDEAGTYNYKFVVVTDETTLGGNAAQENTLTVN